MSIKVRIGLLVGIGMAGRAGLRKCQYCGNEMDESLIGLHESHCMWVIKYGQKTVPDRIEKITGGGEGE
jgi:hypothetical protein